MTCIEDIVAEINSQHTGDLRSFEMGVRISQLVFKMGAKVDQTNIIMVNIKSMA